MPSIKVHRFPSGMQQGLLSQVQTLAGEIENTPISPKKYQRLSRRLDEAFSQIRHFEADYRTSSLFFKSQMEQLEEQCLSLYQKLEDGLVDRELSLIRQESEALKKKPCTLKTIRAVEQHIESLLEKHAPSIEQKRILNDAKRTLVEAKAKVEGKEIPSHFDWLSSQYDAKNVAPLELLPGEIEELFDAAKAVYEGKISEAKRQFLQLPEAHKERFFLHMRSLGATAFTDMTETIQALIATANDLANNGESYLSQQEIDMLFLGLKEVTAEEQGSEEKVYFLQAP